MVERKRIPKTGYDAKVKIEQRKWNFCKKKKNLGKFDNLNTYLIPQRSCEKKEMEVWGFVTGKARPLQTKS